MDDTEPTDPLSPCEHRIHRVRCPECWTTEEHTTDEVLTRSRLVVEECSTRLGPYRRGDHTSSDPVLEFLSLVYDEIKNARAKFPDPGGSMAALSEEHGELAKALLDESSARVVSEATQVACMACRLALEGDPTLDAYRVKSGAGHHPEVQR